ncbi:MAG: flagellar hook-basal body complex protein FliE [Candidatus Eisenbacteria bacterium]
MNGIGAIDRTAGLWGKHAGAMQGLPSLRDVEPREGLTVSGGPAEAGANSPSRTFADVLQEVNGLQLDADRLVERLAAGQIDNVHEVMIAQQEAAIALRLLQEVRDKLVSAYQELMRMQV